uniref:ATP synthase subunit 8 n=1 Tax=Peltospira smaragdina TaxID=216107 RepID=A0A6B7FLY5_9GAST|nr:ATP synthase subunit 8 [Peltospira smaragdina]
MPHLAPINWLIIWFFIWSSFFILTIIIWWKFKTYYKISSLSTSKTSILSIWTW